MLPAQAGVFDEVVSAFRCGGGVSQSQYKDMMWDGLERLTSTWFENLMLQQWIPAMPNVERILNGAVTWLTWDADGGAASSNWRRRFRDPVAWGTTTLARPLRVRAGECREAGVSDRVRFEARDRPNGSTAQLEVLMSHYFTGSLPASQS